MMINGRRISLVERYLNGRMTPTEARDFQLRLESDPRLRQLLRDEQQIEQALRRDSESIPKLGSQRLEKFVKANAGKGPSGPGIAGPLTSAGILQKGVKDILLQLFTGRNFLIMAAVAGTVVMTTMLMQDDDEAPIPLPAATMNAAKTATANDTTKPAAALTSNQSGTDKASIPAPSSAPVNSEPQLTGRDAAKEQAVHMVTADLPAVIDTARPIQMIMKRTAKPSSQQGHSNTSALVSTEDSLDAVIRRMNLEANRQSMNVESSDSVKTKVKLGNGN